MTMDGNTSDGFHTFNELYHYRALYHALWVNELYDSGFNHIDAEHIAAWDLHKSWKHADGELCFGGGWFIVTVNLPSGQVSNHYQARYWDLFHIDARDQASEWDGHTPAEAANRLEKYLAGEW